ncbi:MAG: shikimate kinase [Lachnospiraceae bacterium]|nr:shikimate kinase [Lachnospiraceae bacterium]
MEQTIFLIGFMGCGKSTNAVCLAGLTDTARVEMDEEIAKEQGMAIPRLFEIYGEEHFRNLETEFLRRLLTQKPRIVSCGGGAALREENVKLMKRMGKIVLLTASPKTVHERLKGGEGRPALGGRADVGHIAELMENRRARYEAAADFAVATDGRSMEEICAEILRRVCGENG